METNEFIDQTIDKFGSNNGLIVLHLLTGRGAGYLDKDNNLTKFVNGKFETHPTVQLKDYSTKWFHEVQDKSLIDDRYYNLDGTHK